MIRKALIALAAAAAIGVAMAPTESMAQRGGHGGGGFHGGGFHGGGFHGGGFRGGRGFRGGFRGGFYPAFGWGLYAAPYGVYGDYPYGGCYRARRVMTPYGWRWRRVYVCY